MHAEDLLGILSLSQLLLEITNLFDLSKYLGLLKNGEKRLFFM